MYARIRKNTGTQRQSVIIAHSVWRAGTSKPIVVKVMGHASDEQELKWLHEAAKTWIAQHGQQWLKQHLNTCKQGGKMRGSIFNLRERGRHNVGIKDTFGKLYDELGFNELLTEAQQKVLRQVIFTRLLEPGSKRRATALSKKDFAEELSLDSIYRMMDELITHSQEIETKIFEHTNTLLSGEIELLLFDVTTLWFESITEDELRAFGFSKDCKINNTQVVLALASTKEGLPVGYKLFPGNTAEVSTLVSSIESWKKHINIGKITIAGDRAMLSDGNLTLLEKLGYEYIIAAKLKQQTKAIKTQLLDTQSYTDLGKTESGLNSYKIIALEQGRQLLVTYSKKRAEKDKKDRERLVKKLKDMLGVMEEKDTVKLIKKNGCKKYAKFTGDSKAELDKEKIAADAQWDGLHGVITNKQIKDSSIYNDYRQLWVIEDCFRVNKHDLKMRPIYHYTPRRIRAHILICYIVFALMRYIQFSLSKAGDSMSPKRIIDALRDVQASELIDISTDQKYKMMCHLEADAEFIYKALGLKQNKAIFPV